MDVEQPSQQMSQHQMQQMQPSMAQQQMQSMSQHMHLMGHQKQQMQSMSQKDEYIFKIEEEMNRLGGEFVLTKQILETGLLCFIAIFLLKIITN